MHSLSKSNYQFSSAAAAEAAAAAAEAAASSMKNICKSHRNFGNLET
jgi:hypothetical protein